MIKKIIILCLILLLNVFYTQAMENNNYAGIGIGYFKEPYNHKIIITKIIPNSPAAKCFLPLGAEIVKINDIKVKKLNTNEISNLIKGPKGTSVKLTIKDAYNKKEVYNITRDSVNVPVKKTDSNFQKYWEQVAPSGMEYVEPIHPVIRNKLSYTYCVLYLPQINYWADRKISFQKGYDCCMSYPKSEQNYCLMNLVNREIAKTDRDEEKNIMRQQTNQLRLLNTNLYNR